MRLSRVLSKLRAGHAVNTIKINTTDVRTVEIAAAAGTDSVWLDNEHVPTDWLLLENMVRAAKLHDTDAVVRIERGSYSDYIRPLEMDATGLMIPHIMSAKEASDIVRMTRFHPLGRRPVDGGNVDGFFTQIEPLEYMRQANRERFIMIQIEDPEPLAELDAIAATEGIDILFFGPADFAHAIGKPAQWNAPELGEARRAVARAAAKHGKFAGTACGVDMWHQARREGFQFLSIGVDVIGLGRYFSDAVATFKRLIET